MCLAATILSPLPSHSFCQNASYEEEARSESDPTLYAVNSYVFGYKDLVRMTRSISGIPCQATMEKGNEVLLCQNGVRALGIAKKVPCSIYDKIRSSSRSIVCKLLGYYSSTEWTFYDKQGQAFNSYEQEWKVESDVGHWTGHGFDNCNGGRTEKVLKVLSLSAGSVRLYFVKTAEITYKAIRQPSL